MNQLTSAYLKRYSNGELKLLIQKCKYVIKQRMSDNNETRTSKQ